MAADALALSAVNAYYGDSHILHDVTFQLKPGRLLALMGRNGAGKTTCMNTIIGFLPTRQGHITSFGEAIHPLQPEAIVRRGISLVPQGRRIFPSLTVRENLLVAARKAAKGEATSWTFDAIYALFPRLKERQSQNAGSLSGGEQQMLAIGRALMTQPKVLLLDEPSEGLAPQIVHEVGQILERLKGQVSMVLVEQNIGLATRVADDVVLLNTGRVVFDGSIAEFQQQQSRLLTHLGVS